MVICLERDADLPITVSCFSKIQIGFTFLIPAHTGSPGQRAVKRVCVVNTISLSVAATVLTRHTGSHGVTCHPAELTFPPLPPAPATPEGCKAELT